MVSTLATATTMMIIKMLLLSINSELFCVSRIARFACRAAAAAAAAAEAAAAVPSQAKPSQDTHTQAKPMATGGREQQDFARDWQWRASERPKSVHSLRPQMVSRRRRRRCTKCAQILPAAQAQKARRRAARTSAQLCAAPPRRRHAGCRRPDRPAGLLAGRPFSAAKLELQTRLCARLARNGPHRTAGAKPSAAGKRQPSPHWPLLAPNFKRAEILLENVHLHRAAAGCRPGRFMTFNHYWQT